MSALLPTRLAIAVTFHYVEERLQYLSAIADHFASLGHEVRIVVVTNTPEPEHHARIKAAAGGKGAACNLFVPFGLGHPFLLTWSHFAVFRSWFDDTSISHFLYAEDDIQVTQDNMRYWMAAREQLRATGCYPSFFRVEKKHGKGDWLSSDCPERHDVRALPHLKLGAERVYVNLPTPYQGMYLLDRELMAEHLNGKSSIPEYHKWGIREMAAQGLTFARVRKGFTSRNLVPFSLKTGKIDPACYVHHLPNNYANGTAIPGSKFGTVPADEVLFVSPFKG